MKESKFGPLQKFSPKILSCAIIYSLQLTCVRLQSVTGWKWIKLINFWMRNFEMDQVATNPTVTWFASPICQWGSNFGLPVIYQKNEQTTFIKILTYHMVLNLVWSILKAHWSAQFLNSRQHKKHKNLPRVLTKSPEFHNHQIPNPARETKIA